MSSLIPTRLPLGNDEEAEYLTALHRLTPGELLSAANKVFMTRAAASGLEIAGSMGAHRVSGISEWLAINGGHNPQNAVAGLAAFFGFFYGLRIMRSAANLYTGNIHRDFSVVAQAVKDKTGKPPADKQWSFSFLVPQLRPVRVESRPRHYYRSTAGS